MDERKKQVLHAIIKDYISTAEPVGSRSVAKKYDLGVSPATIRNEMSDLEELGYIEQPHTSSGRIPSDKGYRYYVDCLMEKEELNPKDIAYIKDAFSHYINEADVLIRESCQLLSRLTNYTTVMMQPKLGAGCLEKIQLIPINSLQVLVVILTDTCLVDHCVLDLSAPLDEAELKSLEQYLQHKLCGLKMSQINHTLIREISNQVNDGEKLMNNTLEILEHLLNKETDDKLVLGGTLNMLSQPEFQNVEKVRSILETLEEGDAVKNLLLINKNPNEVSVSIGMEIPHETINKCSLVVASYKIDDQVIGAIGVMGPTRMLYSRTIPLLQFFSEELSDAFTNKLKK